MNLLQSSLQVKQKSPITVSARLGGRERETEREERREPLESGWYTLKTNHFPWKGIHFSFVGLFIDRKESSVRPLCHHWAASHWEGTRDNSDPGAHSISSSARGPIFSRVGSGAYAKEWVSSASRTASDASRRDQSASTDVVAPVVAPSRCGEKRPRPWRPWAPGTKSIRFRFLLLPSGWAPGSSWREILPFLERDPFRGSRPGAPTQERAEAKDILEFCCHVRGKNRNSRQSLPSVLTRAIPNGYKSLPFPSSAFSCNSYPLVENPGVIAQFPRRDSNRDPCGRTRMEFQLATRSRFSAHSPTADCRKCLQSLHSSFSHGDAPLWSRRG